MRLKVLQGIPKCCEWQRPIYECHDRLVHTQHHADSSALDGGMLVSHPMLLQSTQDLGIIKLQGKEGETKAQLGITKGRKGGRPANKLSARVKLKLWRGIRAMNVLKMGNVARTVVRTGQTCSKEHITMTYRAVVPSRSFPGASSGAAYPDEPG